MKTVPNHHFSSKNAWEGCFCKTNQTLEIRIAQGIGGKTVADGLSAFQDNVKHLEFKTLLIHDNKEQQPHLGLDWKIIEACWESICRNDGQRIVISHKNHLPAYLKEMYRDTIKRFGTKVDLQFIRDNS